jgi:hypothetical protein
MKAHPVMLQEKLEVLSLIIQLKQLFVIGGYPQGIQRGIQGG